VNVNLGAGTGSDGWGGTDTLIGIERVDGSAFNDTLSGGAANEVFAGRDGDDAIDGGAGFDSALFDSGTQGAVVDLQAGLATNDGYGRQDTLAGIELVRGSFFADDIRGSDRVDATESFHGMGGNDTIDGRGGVDEVSYSMSYNPVTVNLATGTASDGWGSTDTLLNIENVIGSLYNDRITGDAGVNRLVGNFGNDTLDGGAGADTLIGGAGNDVMNGGTGSDGADYSNATGAVTVSLRVGSASGAEGADTLVSIEQVNGSAYADSISGGDPLRAFRYAAPGVTSEIENLRGGAGADTLSGVQDAITILADYSDAQRGVTVSTVTGTADDGYAAGSADTFVNIMGIRGSAFADRLSGGSSAWQFDPSVVVTPNAFESFEGMEGNDTIDGGLGSDRARYGASPSAVNVNLGAGTGSDGWGGTDTLIGIERVDGSAFNDTLSGGAANEVFAGRDGDDAIDGGAGFDSALFDSGTQGAVVDLQAGLATNDGYGRQDTLAGIEAVRGSYYADDLRGSDRVDATESFQGMDGNDTIDGRGGVDEVSYSFSYNPVTVNLATGTASDGWAGTDTLLNIENVIGSLYNDRITGNAGVNRLVGNFGNDTLDGGAGADTLDGGAGNDTYVVERSGDIVNEFAAGGTDLVKSSVTYSLGNEVENLQLTGSAAIDGVGNGLANTLTGNGAANTLSGGAGIDTLVGGLGDDTYFVEDAGDVIIESANVLNGGIDLVRSSVTRTLGAYQENLVLSGAQAINGTGNGLANELTGNEAANVLTGGGGNDVLDGLDGVDTLIGGAGDDYYVVDLVANGSGGFVLQDVLKESAGAGNDTVEVVAPGVSIASPFVVVLAANFENLLLYDGVGAPNDVAWLLNGTGNGLDNRITGNAAANVLSGGAGNDTLAGAGGNDTYVVTEAVDVVVELTGEGIDLVKASVNYTLTDNVEKLTLTGSGAINGTGNTLVNTLTGNAGANLLDGGAGNDLLYGKAGADTLTGGAGSDKFYFDTAPGAGNVDLITDFTTTKDKIVLDDDIFTAVGAVGVLSSLNFTLGSAATTSAQRVIYDTGTGALYYDADGSGVGAKVQFATLGATTHSLIAAADFQVVS